MFIVCELYYELETNYNEFNDTVRGAWLQGFQHPISLANVIFCLVTNSGSELLVNRLFAQAVKNLRQ